MYKFSARFRTSTNLVFANNGAKTKTLPTCGSARKLLRQLRQRCWGNVNLLWISIPYEASRIIKRFATETVDNAVSNGLLSASSYIGTACTSCCSRASPDTSLVAVKIVFCKYKQNSTKCVISIFAAKDATFYIGRREQLAETFSFGLIHSGWYIAASEKEGDNGWRAAASFDNKTIKFAHESSFIVVPYAMDDPYKNCDTIGPQKPEEPEEPQPVVGFPLLPPGPPSPPQIPQYPGPPGSNMLISITVSF